MADLKCSECGYTIPPDATKCLNCGNKCCQVLTSVASKNNGNGITVGHVGYPIKCEIHGRIHITTTVASALTGCPFC